MDPQSISPQNRIWQLGIGFSSTAVLSTLVKTGVIEQMHDGPRSLSELAQAGGMNADVLRRVLRFAGVVGIINQDDGRYALTETGRLLLKDAPGSMYTGFLLWGSEEWRRVWQDLDYALTTGEAAFPHAMGASAFEYYDQKPELGKVFHQWMTDSSVQAASAVTAAYDFTPFNSVCDVGGGQGLLLKNVIQANPHLRGILYDQEPVLKGNVLADLDGRVEIRAGNFFESVPPASLLMMKRILHDWSDERCQVILGNCRRVMQPDSRLLIIENVIAHPLSFFEVYYDIHMQLMHAGKERTEEEFGALLQEAGMQLRRVIPTDSNMNIVEASL